MQRRFHRRDPVAQIDPGHRQGPRILRRNRQPDLIDIDAGRIATGRASIEELGWELFHYYLDVASGKQQTWAEKHKLHNDITLFNPAPIT